MKSLIAFSMLFPSVVLAQEFQKPTQEDLLAVSFNFLEESRKVMQQPLTKDCDENKEKEAAKKMQNPIPAKGDEIVCLCELDDKREGLLETLFGDIKGQELTVTSGNDNFMHGVLQLNKDAALWDGDDRGRTFNVGGNYKITGEKGEFQLKLDSTGFGKFNRDSGPFRDENGKYYLNYKEVNTLDLTYNRIHQKNEKGSLYSLYDFNLTHQTDKGYASRDLQEWWHDLHSEEFGLNMIRYHYLQEQDDKTSVRIMSGLGKEWISKIDKWKCITKAELKGGFTAARSGLTPEIAARTEASLSHSSVKWVVLSGWLQARAGYMGKAYEGGVNLSLPFKSKNFTIEPFIGIERHRTQLDKSFGGSKGNAFENYHVFGVTIKY